MCNTNHKRVGVFINKHANTFLQYKPTKCTFFEKLIFEFLSFDVSNPRVHLKEDGCIYRYGIDHTCIYNRQKLKY